MRTLNWVLFFVKKSKKSYCKILTFICNTYII
nr:MAG TPA: hypothetical protein [Caudoviricetes sp.]